jgi:hypothetical protein
MTRAAGVRRQGSSDAAALSAGTPNCETALEALMRHRTYR